MEEFPTFQKRSETRTAGKQTSQKRRSLSRQQGVEYEDNPVVGTPSVFNMAFEDFDEEEKLKHIRVSHLKRPDNLSLGSLVSFLPHPQKHSLEELGHSRTTVQNEQNAQENLYIPAQTNIERKVSRRRRKSSNNVEKNKNSKHLRHRKKKKGKRRKRSANVGSANDVPQKFSAQNEVSQIQPNQQENRVTEQEDHEPNTLALFDEALTEMDSSNEVDPEEMESLLQKRISPKMKNVLKKTISFREEVNQKKDWNSLRQNSSKYYEQKHESGQDHRLYVFQISKTDERKKPKKGLKHKIKKKRRKKRKSKG
eukprot:augustus_masked-scaffold_7-processed-gene-6.49-mRNA-1 protein AED:1.00 eAED:1.00 QI:0/-1/0/0/-1/1/1/0/309